MFRETGAFILKTDILQSLTVMNMNHHNNMNCVIKLVNMIQVYILTAFPRAQDSVHLYSFYILNTVFNAQISWYTDDTQQFCPPPDTSSWMKNHHLKHLKLNIWDKSFSMLDLTISDDTWTVHSTYTAKHLHMILNNRVNFSNHITATTRSCRFLLHNVGWRCLLTREPSNYHTDYHVHS